jgi:hypothetical protein
MLGSNKKSALNLLFSYVATVNKLWLLFVLFLLKNKINPPNYLSSNACPPLPMLLFSAKSHSFFSLSLTLLTLLSPPTQPQFPVKQRSPTTVSASSHQNSATALSPHPNTFSFWRRPRPSDRRHPPLAGSLIFFFFFHFPPSPSKVGGHPVSHQEVPPETTKHR